MLEDQQLLECSERGFLVGPSESEEELLTRASLAPTSADFPQVKELYGTSPDWVEVKYAKLPFWQGGVCICDETVRVHLTRSLERNERFLFYSKEEILNHEGVHALRATYDEPRFEEILAYKTSKSPLRRFLGPLFRANWESYAFLGGLTIACLLNYFSPIWLLIFIWGAKFVFLRLFYDHFVFARMMKRLTVLTGSKSAALKLALRLTDKEISQFSRQKPAEIQEYAAGNNTLRWRQIKLEFKCLCDCASR